MFNIVFWGPVVCSPQPPQVAGCNSNNSNHLIFQGSLHSTCKWKSSRTEQVMLLPVWMDVGATSSISPTAGTKQQLSQSVSPRGITRQTYSERSLPLNQKVLILRKSQDILNVFAWLRKMLFTHPFLLQLVVALSISFFFPFFARSHA